MGGKSLTQKRQSDRQSGETAPRRSGFGNGIVVRLDHINRSPTAQVAKIEFQRLLRRGVVRAVQSPIAGDYVHLAVAVDIACGYSVPPAGIFVQAEFGCGFAQLASLIFENANRPPFTSENQLRKAVTVQVTPDGAADQADFFQQTAVLRIQMELVPVAAIDSRGSSLGVAPRNYTSAGEQIEVAVRVQVRQRQRARARFLSRQTVVQGFVCQLVLPHATAGHQSVLI